MKQKILIIIAIISFSTFYLYLGKRNVDHYLNNQFLLTTSSRHFSDLTFSTLTGESKNILHLVNSNQINVFLHFWATWCAPCEKELESLISRIKEARNNNKFIFIAVNDDTFKIKKFLSNYKEIPKNIVWVMDNSNIYEQFFGSVKVPETFLYNVNGQELKHFVGPQDWTSPFLSKFLESF